MRHRTSSLRGGRRTAFSLLELLAVVTILGIIAVIVIPRVALSSAATKEKACFRNKAEINRAIERYYFNNGSWPANLSDINTPGDFPDGIPTCPTSGGAYTINGTTKRVQGHTTGSH
jgi:prepilin-type N-terminal cleavage/methylation domain-containing protein